MKTFPALLTLAASIATLGLPSARSEETAETSAPLPVSVTRPNSPNTFPIHFVSFNVVGICISGNNDDSLEKTFVDGFSVWACSHYFHSVRIANATADSKQSLDEKELIAQNQDRVLSVLKRSGKRTVDLYLFGHSNTFADPLVAMLDDVQKELGDPVKVRFVYNSGCYNFSDDVPLQKIADAYVGHKGIDYGPVYSPILLEQWFSKIPIGWAVGLGNAAIDRRPYTTTEAGTLHDFMKGLFDRNAKEDNDPKGYLTGNANLIF